MKPLKLKKKETRSVFSEFRYYGEKKGVWKQNNPNMPKNSSFEFLIALLIMCNQMIICNN